MFAMEPGIEVGQSERELNLSKNVSEAQLGRKRFTCPTSCLARGMVGGGYDLGH